MNSVSRECARGRHCRSSTRDDEGALHPALTGNVFCDADTANIRRALNTLPDLYQELGHRLTTRQQTGTGERVSSSRTEPPSPIDLDAERLMTNIGALVGSWEERVRAAVGFPAAPVDVSWGNRPEMVARACTTLTFLVPRLVALPPEPMRRALTHEDLGALPEDVLGVVRPAYVDVYPELSGADAGREILWLHRRAETATGNTAPVVALDGVACPSCGLMMLSRRSGEDTVSCGACNHAITGDDYTTHVQTLVERATA